MKSCVPAASFKALDSRLLTKLCAPSARASSSFAAEVEKAVTSAPKTPGELNGDVSQAADAYDADPRRGVDAVGAQGVIDRDAAAQQRRGVFAIESFGNGYHKARIGPDRVRVAAMAMDAGALRIRAKILHAAHAPLADAAGVGLPAQAHALANLERSHLRADSCNRADNLVAGNERILADAPVVRDEVKIAVADAAVSNGDLNLMQT